MARYVFVLDGTGAHHTRLAGFLNSHLEQNDFLFLFCGPFCEAAKIEGINNARIVSSFFKLDKSVKEEIDGCKKLLIVGMFDVEMSLFLAFNGGLLKKTTVALHGGEFYGQRGRTSFKRKAFYFLRRRLIARMEACCTFTPGDYEVAKRFYLLPKRHYLAELPWHFDVPSSAAAEGRSSNPCIIMVGHNALKEDHTIEALYAISKFKNENMKIIAPLSYGDDQYRKEVLAVGRSLFGEKFCPLLDWLEPNDYQRLLQSVSVFVIGVDRQAGTFNINLMLRLGCKVYARTDTSIWSFFHDECGCRLFDIKTIEEFDWIEFVAFSLQERMHNHDSLKRRLNEGSCLASWMSILA